MIDFIITNKTYISLAFFISLLSIGVLLEQVIAYKQSSTKLHHFSQNAFISVFNTFFLRILLFVNLLGVSAFAADKQFGLFNLFNTPIYTEIILGILLFDLAIYWQHRLMHDIPILWKLHGVHHSDQLIDVSTGVRFHLFEILFSYSLKILIVLLLGLSPITIIVFEIILSSFSLFIHSNIKLPTRLNSGLKLIFLTPETHRIHHTVLAENIASHGEIGSSANKYVSYNFGTSLNCWDRIFNSYMNKYQEDREQEFGRLEQGKKVSSLSFWQILSEPFRKT